MPTIVLYWSPGRTAQQKKLVVENITETLVEHGGARREDVLIIFQDIQPGDAGRGGKMLGVPAQNASPDERPPDV